MTISFLHTSKSHIARFDQLVKDIDPSMTVEHFVNERLLEVAMKEGKIDKNAFDQQIRSIKKSKGHLIICTCSTYGELCDKYDNVCRIDQPIVEEIVLKYRAIGLAFTVESTKKVSKKLISAVAQTCEIPVNIIEFDCSAAWQHFEKGDIKRYAKEIANIIERNLRNIDVIFLAQASMEGAIKHFNNQHIKVVSSAEFGTKYFINKFKKEPKSL